MDKLPWLGASVKRKEDDRLLRGIGRFLDDVEETRTCTWPSAAAHTRMRASVASMRRARSSSRRRGRPCRREVVARTEPITVLRPFPGSAPTVLRDGGRRGALRGRARGGGGGCRPVRGRGRARADRRRLRAAPARRRPSRTRSARRPPAPRHCAGKRRPRIDRARGRAGQAAGRRGRHRRRHVPDQPGEWRADRDARRDRAVGGGHEHARAVGFHADAASLARPARALSAHGRDRRARDRAGRRGRLRPQDRRVPPRTSSRRCSPSTRGAR